MYKRIDSILTHQGASINLFTLLIINFFNFKYELYEDLILIIKSFKSLCSRDKQRKQDLHLISTVFQTVVLLLNYSALTITQHTY